MAFIIKWITPAKASQGDTPITGIYERSRLFPPDFNPKTWFIPILFAPRYRSPHPPHLNHRPDLSTKKIKTNPRLSWDRDAKLQVPSIAKLLGWLIVIRFSFCFFNTVLKLTTN